MNHIDLETADAQGIRILSLNGETDFLRNVRATAEHTVALMLALIRCIPAAVAHTSAGGWDRDRFRGSELYGKTVGIVGYGRIGQLVESYLAAFGAQILVTDPAVAPAQLRNGVRSVLMEDLLRTSDLVTLHVNYAPHNSCCFGKQFFEAMRPRSFFVNTSRGELIDERALLDALQSGCLGGAAVDVLAGEHTSPSWEHPLMAYSRRAANLLITPHIGGCTIESMEKTEVFLASKLVRELSWNGTASF
jgi:D-3-phosphoglycerate dehydrogenase